MTRDKTSGTDLDSSSVPRGFHWTKCGLLGSRLLGDHSHFHPVLKNVQR